jgi:hypothetical protein
LLVFGFIDYMREMRLKWWSPRKNISCLTREAANRGCRDDERPQPTFHSVS